MTLNLLECVVYLLASYGLFTLVISIFDRLRCRIRGPRPLVRIVLLVKNAQEQIEYIVRNSVMKEYASKLLSDRKIMIVDMASEDNTYELLERLEKSLYGIETLQYKDREQIYKGF
ncbi:MAG: hypothetical protein GXY17_08665 [Clostridiaceae bacterium]|nr:hypothetical protein [Clostridiaceae bacterium]